MEIKEIRNELVKYSATDAAIAEMSKNYLALTIKDINDQEEYKLVHTARMDVKAKRVAVKKRGEELREDANKFRGAVIDEVKRITSLLEPIESHLQDQENRVEEEKARIKREAEEKAAEELRQRENTLSALGCNYYDRVYSYGELTLPTTLLAALNDDQFATFVDKFSEAIEKDKAIEAEKKRLQKEEEDRLAQVAKAQEVERLRLAAEAKKIQDERDSMERQKKEAEEAFLKAEQAKKHAAEIERARAEAAAQALKDAEEKRKRDEEAKVEKERKAREAAERKAARAPDKVKMVAYAKAILGIPQPQLKTEEAIDIFRSAIDGIGQLLAQMNKEMEEL